MLGPSVSLNPVEQALAKHIVACRKKANEADGASRPLESKAYDPEVQLNAVGGELAFAKIANYWPEVTLVTRHPYPEADACNNISAGIDVKTTDKDDPRWVYVHVDCAQSTCAYYAFMAGKFPDYVYLGFVGRDDLFIPENLKDLGNGPCYNYPTHLLVKEYP